MVDERNVLWETLEAREAALARSSMALAERSTLSMWKQMDAKDSEMQVLKSTSVIFF